MAFTEKLLNFTFQLANGNTFANGFNTVQVSGLRSQVRIQNAGGAQTGAVATARIYGLTPDIMNSLWPLVKQANGYPLYTQNNMMIEAGDSTLMSGIFQGQIMTCAQSMKSPDAAIEIYAISGAFQMVQFGSVLSYPGSASVVNIMQTLANQAGVTLINKLNNDVILATPYLPGTIGEQIKQLAKAANINATFDNGNLILWEIGDSSDISGNSVVVSVETGMVGYPEAGEFSYDFNFKTVFNPNITIGDVVQVNSSLTYISGFYTANAIEHTLDSQVPDGQWFTSFHGNSIVATSE